MWRKGAKSDVAADVRKSYLVTSMIVCSASAMTGGTSSAVRGVAGAGRSRNATGWTATCQRPCAGRVAPSCGGRGVSISSKMVAQRAVAPARRARRSQARARDEHRAACARTSPRTSHVTAALRRDAAHHVTPASCSRSRRLAAPHVDLRKASRRGLRRCAARNWSATGEPIAVFQTAAMARIRLCGAVRCPHRPPGSCPPGRRQCD